MPSLLLLSLLILFLAQFVISLLYVLKIIMQYRDTASIQLLIAFLFLNLSIFFSIFWSVDIIEATITETTTFLFRLFLISLFITGIGACLILDKKFYSFLTRLLAKTTFALYTICIGLSIADLLTREDNFYYLKTTGAKVIPYYGFYAGLFLVIANLLLLLTVYLSYRDLKKMPKLMAARNSFSIITGSIILIIAVFVVRYGLQIINVVTIGGNYINLSYYFILNFVSIVFTYFSFNQTFLHFSGSPNPSILIKKGFIGYYLSSVTNNGPEPVLYSQTFVENSKLPQESLLALAFSAISIVGMFSGTKENSFKSRVSLIPVPGTENYSTLVYTFFTKNEANDDERIKEHAPTAYCILFPSNFSLDLRKMTTTLSDVLALLEKDTNITVVNNESTLRSLTEIILRKMLA